MGTGVGAVTTTGVDPTAAARAAAEAAAAAKAAKAADAPITTTDPLPADMPVTTTEPVESAEVQLADAQERLSGLLAKAAKGAFGIRGNLCAEILAKEPRPRFGHAGHCKHKDVTNAAAVCEKAMAALGKISAQDLGAQTPEAMAALNAYVQAFNDLGARLLKYHEKTEGANPEIMKLYTATQFRIGEALNLAATLQGACKNGGTVEGKALDSLSQMAPTMHGALVLKGVQGQADALLSEIAQLEQQQSARSFTNFQASVRELKQQTADLKGIVQGIQDAPLQDGGTLQVDTSLHVVLEGMLQRAETRLAALERAEPRKAIAQAVTDMLPDVDPKMFQDLKQLNLPLFNSLIEKYETAAQTFNTEMQSLRNEIASGTRYRRGEFGGRVLNIITQFRRDANVPEFSKLLKKTFTLTIGNITQTTFQKTLQEVFQGQDLGEEALKDSLSRIDSLAEWMELPLDLWERSNSVGNRLLSSDPAVYFAQAGTLDGMMQRATTDHAIYHNEHILATFDHSTPVLTILEASLRGLPMDQLELRAGDETLAAPPKILGHGAANAVSLCTYRGADGEHADLVFKPEIGARTGLARLYFSNLGYDDNVNVMQLNVATTRVADALGCGNVVARSSIGTHNGKLGLFMERAPGSVAAAYRSAKSMKATDVGRALGTGERKEAARVNLMRELSNLEWADILTGQVDRHSENYLVEIHPETGDVKVTGIDNDASFGWRRIGMHAIDVSEFKVPEELLDACDSHINPRVLYMDMVPAEHLQILRTTFGINQLITPTHIDRQTYNNLIAIDPEEYDKMLTSCMDRNAVDAAVRRLLEAQAYVKGELEDVAPPTIVDDWNTVETPKSVKGTPAGEDAQSILSGFFARDFAHLF